MEHNDGPNPLLLPRKYQEEVFVRAQSENIIAALDTGSGKTFISTLLVKWVAAQESSHGKVIIFLVPQVSLVEQQGEFLAKHTPLRVIKLYGAMEIDLTDRKGWRKKFENNDVFVMTPQIFLNLLTHSHWSIDRVSLLVFDECHHARKSHPYNGIMREYFQLQDPKAVAPNSDSITKLPSVVASPSRPKIFGMTASPIWKAKNPVEALSSLEKNLDAKVIGVRAHIEELAKHAPKPVELIEEYLAPPSSYPSYPAPTLWSALNVFAPWTWPGITVDIPWTNIESRYLVTLNNLGPYAAELYLFLEMEDRISQILASSQNLTTKSMDPAILCPLTIDSDIGVSTWTDKSIPVPPEVVVAESIISAFQSSFRPPMGHPSPLPLQIPLTWCSPKVASLACVLVKQSLQSSTFQGIIFVEQRQVAMSLANILPCIPELEGLVKCGVLVGQGINLDGIKGNTKGMSEKGDAVKSFRERRINLLIATSAAEEGLDFPACELVVRFDPLRHIVGYLQSRGRARNPSSKFIVMVQKNDSAHLARYQAFIESEPELKRVYQARDEEPVYDEDEDEMEDTHQDDLAARERYVVSSTGAVLTYDNSINLLNYLSSLIPHDIYTPGFLPRYEGSNSCVTFEATVHLPPSLPLSPHHLVYHGPPKRSKREAKRAVAFLAARALHGLDVFDDYLLPVPNVKVDDVEENFSTVDVNLVPNVMDVMVRDPWTMDVHSKLWLHPLIVDGKCVAGLVTGTVLPPSEVICSGDGSGSLATIRPGELLKFDFNDDGRSWEILQEFTRSGIWHYITARPFNRPVGLFVVPVVSTVTTDGAHMYQPDFDSMLSHTYNPDGSFDWTNITEENYGSLTITNRNKFGQPLLLRRIRHDLTPMSVPQPGSLESGFSSYYDYYMKKWVRKKSLAIVPTDGPLIEAVYIQRYTLCNYSMEETPEASITHTVPNGTVIPQGCCRWLALSEDIRTAFRVLPPLCHRITDVYRVRQARIGLGLPPIPDNLLIEAFTLPCAMARYSNQRMETLGDAVLQVCTTVHLFNGYPHRHEGQLSAMRQSIVSNRSLLGKAKEIGLEQFLISETQRVNMWPYTLPLDYYDKPEPLRGRYAARQFPRRSLQDCMEATLGAAFVAGGIPMALHTGTSLGLAFGGPLPWPLRYGRPHEASPAPALFDDLQERLGYKFHQCRILLEAVTHPSFASLCSNPSYQRLEFLGDAILDLVVIKYLYDKFPDATSDQMAWPRTRAICAPALASLAVRELGLHKIMLVNNVELSIAINQFVPLLEVATGEYIVRMGWKLDPPKAISDVFESVIGAVLVDSGYDFEKTTGVVEYVMRDVLAALSPSLRRDPVSELLEWTAGSGCLKTTFFTKNPGRNANNNISVSFLTHDVTVVGPVNAASVAVAKAIAAERALLILRDPNAEKSLMRLCDCRTTPQVGAHVDEVLHESLETTLSLTCTVLDEVCEGSEDASEKVVDVGSRPSDSDRTTDVQDEQEVLEILPEAESLSPGDL